MLRTAPQSAAQKRRAEAKRQLAEVPVLKERKAEVLKEMEALQRRIDGGELTARALQPLVAERDKLARAINYALNDATTILVDTACELWPDLKAARDLLFRERRELGRTIARICGELATQRETMKRHLDAIDEVMHNDPQHHERFSAEKQPAIRHCMTEIEHLVADETMYRTRLADVNKAVAAARERCLTQ